MRAGGCVRDQFMDTNRNLIGRRNRSARVSPLIAALKVLKDALVELVLGVVGNGHGTRPGLESVGLPAVTHPHILIGRDRGFGRGSAWRVPPGRTSSTGAT